MIERKVKTVRALERGLQVMAEVERRQGVNLHELHVALGLPKATLLRMLVTLSKHGQVWQRLADGAFLPTRVRARGQPASLHERIAQISSPHLARLSEEVAWPSVIAVPRADHLEIVETNSALLRLDSITLGPVGSRLSYIHTSIGRAYLCACDEGERRAIIERIRPGQPDPEGVARLKAILATTAERGYALRDPFHPWPDRNWRDVRQDGRRSMSVAVRVDGRAVAALNITWLVRRSNTETVVKRHLGALQRTAEAISAQLQPKFVPTMADFHT